MDIKRQQQLRALSALAAISLAVHELATREHASANDAIRALLPSIENIGAKRFEDYYPTAWVLEEGRKALWESLGQQDFAPFRLLPLLVSLEKRLTASPKWLQMLRQGLNRIAYQKEALSLDYPEQRALFSALYRDVVTENIGAIKIYGHQELLQKEERVQQIRLLLLLGLRASALWRDSGGGMWRDFFWGRGALKRDLGAIGFE